MESPVGWVLPGGFAYKLGRRSGRKDTDPRWKPWPFVGGALDGWNYNVGRERSLRERGIDE
jgi:hypothetical protein